MANAIAPIPPKVYHLVGKKTYKNDQKQGNKEVLCEWYKHMSHEISEKGHFAVYKK